MVEKYGVRPSDVPKDPFGGCSRTFYKHNTVSRRVEDLQRVLAELEAAPWWDQRLVLFGGSEGGAVVSMLAPRVTPTAVVIFSTAPGRSFRETFKLAVPPAVAAQADSEFAKISANPLSSKVWGGNSYRWWADILDYDGTADLLSVHAPILVVQGERDGSAPVQVARMLRDDFQRAGHSNLTYWEFADYDHQMHDAAGLSHLDEVMQRISAWLVGIVGTAHKVDESAPATLPPSLPRLSLQRLSLQRLCVPLLSQPRLWLPPRPAVPVASRAVSRLHFLPPVRVLPPSPACAVTPLRAGARV